MFNNEHITFIVLKVLKSQVKCYPFITHLWGKVHYLVFMFKGFITRTINTYSSKIMNSTGIQNQGQNQVLPARRLWPPGVLSIPALSVCGNVHRPVPVFPCPWCMCGSLCVFTCVRACALWCQEGRFSGGALPGPHFPRGAHCHSVLLLLLLCVPTSGFRKPLRGTWAMSHSPHRADGNICTPKSLFI